MNEIGFTYMVHTGGHVPLTLRAALLEMFAQAPRLLTASNFSENERTSNVRTSERHLGPASPFTFSITSMQYGGCSGRSRSVFVVCLMSGSRPWSMQLTGTLVVFYRGIIYGVGP